MKVFEDLTIHTKGNIKEAISWLKHRLPSEWTYDQERSGTVDYLPSLTLYAFEIKSANIGSATLWLSGKDGDLAVTNIVPTDKNELTIDEYNAILNHFAHCLPEHLFEFTITKDDVDLADLIGNEAATKLSTFSSCANKSTGRSHPSDERRWLEFLLCMVRLRKTIDFDALVYFLKEQGWDEESAYQLALDYSYGCRAMEFALQGDL